MFPTYDLLIPAHRRRFRSVWLRRIAVLILAEDVLLLQTMPSTSANILASSSVPGKTGMKGMHKQTPT